MVKSNTEDTELQALHSYNIDVKNREIFLHSHFGYDEDESGVDYRSSVCFEKNLRFLNQQSSDNILIHMHSPGGDWEDCLSMYDTIRYSKAKTTILGYAKVQSASSIIFQAASTRILMPNVNMLIHYGSISIDDEHKAAISSLQWSERESSKLLDILIMNEPFNVKDLTVFALVLSLVLSLVYSNTNVAPELIVSSLFVRDTPSFRVNLPVVTVVGPS